MKFPKFYNVTNSQQLAQKLQDVIDNQEVNVLSFDISNLYTNVHMTGNQNINKHKIERRKC